MMKKWMNRRTAALLCAALMCAATVCGMALYPWRAAAEAGVCTNQQAAQRIALACDDYAQPAPTAADILAGLDPEAGLTNASGAAMLYRGFGELPEATGQRDLIGYRDTAFTDVPEELSVYVENLTDAMIYIPKDNALFEPEAAMSEDELAQLIDRIYTYLGSNLKDDYFTAVNREELFAPLDETFDPRGTWFHYLESDSAFNDWIDALLKGSADSDAPYMRNIAAYYSTYISREARENGMPLLKAYMDDILAAPDAEALLAVIENISSETGFPLLLLGRGIYVGINQQYVYELAFERPVISANPDDYLPGGLYATSDDIHCITQALVETGYSEQDASEIAHGYFQTLRNIASLLLEEERDISLGAAFDIAAYLRLTGYPVQEAQIDMDEQYLDVVLRLMQDPETFRAYQCASVYALLVFAEDAVAPRVLDWLSGWWIEFFSADMQRYLEGGTLENSLFPALSHDITEAFFSAFDIQAETEKLQRLFADLKEVFLRMIAQADWMSEETKEGAVKKLNAMTCFIGVGEDFWAQERAQYVPASQGGTLFENYCLYKKADNINTCRYLGMDAHDLERYVNQVMPIQSNCYAIHNSNGIYISLPYLYNDYMQVKSEAVYYANAIVIGHEIVHGFDIDGSRYDWQGNPNNWWTPEDRAHFEALCKRVEEYYDRTEFAPGLRCDSALNNGEDVADIGGLQLVLAVAGERENFDYDAFFRHWARKFTMLSSRQGFTYWLYNDPHAVNRVRINPLYSLMDEFYETYGIVGGDGMYVPPEDRVRVW